MQEKDGQPGKAYPEAKRKDALVALARSNGKVTQTAKEMGVSVRSLTNWRKQYHEFYYRAALDNATAIEERTVADLRERLDASNDVEAEVLRRLEDAIKTEELTANTLATILQRLAIVKGINADKLLKLTGRSSAVPVTDPSELIARLAKRGIIDVTATVVEEEPEIEKPALMAGSSPNGNGE